MLKKIGVFLLSGLVTFEILISKVFATEYNGLSTFYGAQTEYKSQESNIIINNILKVVVVPILVLIRINCILEKK